jgi:hypothetical protein
MDADERAEKIRAEIAAARLPATPEVPLSGSARFGTVPPPGSPVSPVSWPAPPIPSLPVTPTPTGKASPRPQSQAEVVAITLGWAATLLGALIGVVTFLGGVMSAGPAQQTAAAVLALAWVLLPYCATRALAEIFQIWRSVEMRGSGRASLADDDNVKFCAAGEHIIPADAPQCPVCGAKEEPLRRP